MIISVTRMTTKENREEKKAKENQRSNRERYLSFRLMPWKIREDHLKYCHHPRLTKEAWLFSQVFVSCSLVFLGSPSLRQPRSPKYP